MACKLRSVTGRSRFWWKTTRRMVTLIRKGLRQAKTKQHLSVGVIDGNEALRLLRREDGLASAPRPHVVLLDLNCVSAARIFTFTNGTNWQMCMTSSGRWGTSGWT